MAEGKRNKLSLEQRIEMWGRWKAGESKIALSIMVVRS